MRSLEQAGTVTLEPLKRRGKRRLAWLIGGIGALLLAACLSPTPFLHMSGSANGDARVTVTRSGVSRIKAKLDRPSQPWKNFVLTNGGNGIARGIRLWDLGRSDVFITPRRIKNNNPIYTPFNLLPGETFSCSSSGVPHQADSLISGLFYWELPKDPAMARGSFARIQKAEMDTNGLQFHPLNDEAYIELHFTAPLPHVAARVAWRTPSVHFCPQVWINMDGSVWARLQSQTPQVDWLHPIDLTAVVAGHRAFWLRLSCEHKEETGTRQNGDTEQAADILALSQIRVEREIQGIGSLRAWHAGINELSLSLTAPDSPRIELSLLEPPQ